MNRVGLAGSFRTHIVVLGRHSFNPLLKNTDLPSSQKLNHLYTLKMRTHFFQLRSA